MANDIEIDLSVTGLEKVRAAFSDVRADSDSTGRVLEKSSEGAEEGFGNLEAKVGDAFSQVEQLVATIAKITMVAAIAGASAFAAAIAKARSSVSDTAQSLSEMSTAAESLDVSVFSYSGFQFAVEKLGGDAADAHNMMKVLRDTAYEAAEGSEDAQDKLAQFGLIWQQIIDPSDYSLRSPIDIIREMTIGYENVKDKIDGLRSSQKAFGDESGLYFYKIMSGGIDDLNASLIENEKLRGIEYGDEIAAKKFIENKAREKAAIDGLSNSFFKGYAAYADYASADRTEGFVAMQGVTEDLGEAFGRLVFELTPSLIALLETAGGQLIDIFKYLATGETDAPWIKSLSDGLSEAKTSFVDFKGNVDDALEKFDEFATAIDDKLRPQFEKLAPEVEKAFSSINDKVIPAFDAIESRFDTFAAYASTTIIPLFGTTLSQAVADFTRILEAGEIVEGDPAWLQALAAIGEGISDTFSILSAISGALHDIADFVTGSLKAIFGIDITSAGLIAGVATFGLLITKIMPVLKVFWSVLMGADALLGKFVNGILGFIGISLASNSGIVQIFTVISGLLGDLFAATLVGISSVATRIGLVSAATTAATAVGLTAAGAAAGLGAGAAIGATYVAVTSQEELQTKMEDAGAKATTLAETHGQEYAAAYYKSVLAKLEEEAGAAGLINDFFGLFGVGTDFEKGAEDLENIMRKGGEAAANASREGLIQAYIDNGWEVDPDGTVMIGAGMTISGEDLISEIDARLKSYNAEIDVSAADSASDSLESVDGEINVSKLTGVEEAFNAAIAQANFDVGNLAFSGTVEQEVAAMTSQAQQQIPSGGAVVSFNFGDGTQETATVYPSSAISGLISRRNRGVV